MDSKGLFPRRRRGGRLSTRGPASNTTGLPRWRTREAPPEDPSHQVRLARCRTAGGRNRTAGGPSRRPADPLRKEGDPIRTAEGPIRVRGGVNHRLEGQPHRQEARGPPARLGTRHWLLGRRQGGRLESRPTPTLLRPLRGLLAEPLPPLRGPRGWRRPRSEPRTESGIGRAPASARGQEQHDQEQHTQWQGPHSLPESLGARVQFAASINPAGKAWPLGTAFCQLATRWRGRCTLAHLLDELVERDGVVLQRRLQRVDDVIHGVHLHHGIHKLLVQAVGGRDRCLCVDIAHLRVSNGRGGRG